MYRQGEFFFLSCFLMLLHCRRSSSDAARASIFASKRELSIIYHILMMWEECVVISSAEFVVKSRLMAVSRIM